MRYRHLSVAIPILAELENLPKLIESLQHQSLRDFDVYFCVNNPEGWSNSGDVSQRNMYLDNQEAMSYLREQAKENKSFRLILIDRSSLGNGWQGKQHGVGWARKTLFEAIEREHDDNELIVSLDADTLFSDTYLESVHCTMNEHYNHSALCVPYYHPLSGNELNDRAMLRYEIYMRHYLINLLESNNPYAFTALGSAMVFPIWAYRRVRGITPLQGGEDFYLMQKFAKTGKILLSCNETVEPQGRPSSRVPFGTGPAIAKGIDYMNDTYPFYPHEGFEAVARTFSMFQDLYEYDQETPMNDFLRQQLKTDNLWQPLRKNFKTKELFIHACHERVDGLRILQYLKIFPLRTAEEELHLFCKSHRITISEDFDFKNTCISEINSLRYTLFNLESSLRKVSL
ncbi:MAG: hypothetical protein J6X58_00745 [Bacteroidales bacterium]|nr:hypothetical protein [Bacteroidales bacterium]